MQIRHAQLFCLLRETVWFPRRGEINNIDFVTGETQQQPSTCFRPSVACHILLGGNCANR